jgi:ubiquinone/menaquinone biosynthesis C-methylase UbiE
MRYKNHIEHYKIDGEYYNYFALDKFMVEGMRRRYQEFFSLYKIDNDDVILEIGSGGGPALSALNNLKCRYYMLDVSERNLKRIKQSKIYPVFPTAGDIYKIPFIANTFNLIIISEVLEHLSDPLMALNEVKKVLKEDGFLIISVPYKEKITYQICIHCNKPTPTHSHLHSFDTNSLEKLVIDAGYKPYRFSKNLNIVPQRLHLYLLFKKLPFKLWKAVDAFFNLILDKPASLIIMCKKN